MSSVGQRGETFFLIQTIVSLSPLSYRYEAFSCLLHDKAMDCTLAASSKRMYLHGV